MGLFKQVKQAREVIREAPGTIAAARDLAAQAEAFGAGQTGQFGHAGVALGGTMMPDELTPIAGISLERYAQPSKTLGERRLDGASARHAAHGRDAAGAHRPAQPRHGAARVLSRALSSVTVVATVTTSGARAVT